MYPKRHPLQQLLLICNPWLTSNKRFHTFLHFYAALFSIKACFYESVFFISATRRNFRKLLSVSESSIKVKVRLHWTLLLTLLTSVVICKQRLLHGNEIVQYLQSWKCYNVGQDHSKKPV